MKIKSLKTKLIIVLLVIGISPILIFGGLSIKTTQASMEKETYLEIEKTAIGKANEMDFHFKQRMDEALFISNFKQIKDACIIQSQGYVVPPEINKNLEESSQNILVSTGFDRLFLAGRNGEVWWDSDKVEMNLDTCIGTDEILCDFFKDYRNSTQLHFSDYHLCPSKKCSGLNGDIIFISIPVATQKCESLLFLKVNTSDIKKVLEKGESIGESEKRILIDDVGRILPAKNEIEDVIKDKSSDEIYLPKELNGRVSEYNNHYGEIVLGGDGRISELNWNVIIEVDRSEAFKEILETQKGITYGTVLLSISIVIITILITDNITNPIKKLQRGFKSVENGKLEINVDIRTQDELEDLANSFNKMVKELNDSKQKIRTYTEELEKEVKSRTEQLNERVDDLKKQRTATLKLLKDVNKTKKDLEKANEKLNESEGRIRSLLDNSPDHIINIDLKGMIIFINRPLTGLGDKWVVGANIFELIPKPYLKDHLNAFEEAISGNATLTAQMTVEEGNELRWYESIFGPVDVDGRIKSVLLLTRDITERKGYEQNILAAKTDLEKSNIELENYTYVVSHDLKEPLRSITSFSQFLLDDYSQQLDETGKDYLNRVLNATKRMEKLIEDLLMLSRVGRKDTEYSLVDLNEVVSNVLDDLQKLVEEKNAKIIFSNLPMIFCQKTWISELFKNLLGNAIKYNESELPTVGIEFDEIERFYIFSITDNGIGIDPKYHEKIFGLFERLHTRQEYEGTGAGLTIAKSIVEEHKGSIGVESEKGSGSKFIFTISKSINKR